jgi:Glycosyl hydrolase family 26
MSARLMKMSTRTAKLAGVLAVVIAVTGSVAEARSSPDSQHAAHAGRTSTGERQRAKRRTSKRNQRNSVTARKPSAKRTSTSGAKTRKKKTTSKARSTASAASHPTSSTAAATTSASSSVASTSATVVTPSDVGTKMPCIYSSDHVSMLDEFGNAVGRAFSCASVYNAAAPDWSSWQQPWFINQTYLDESWKAWATAPGTHRTLIITQNMFPSSEDSSDWLRLGASGAFEDYAKTLATNLVTAGLGSSVIRLGHEANGDWFPDSIPDTPNGDAEWIKFWDNTVTAMRSVAGANFLFDWTVNAGYRNIPLADWYPGDAYVNIIGIDAYDAGVPSTVPFGRRWSYLYDEADGIGAVEGFAAVHGKPLSIGEWGIEPAQGSTLSAGDDPAYVDGIASVVRNDNVAYQSYFDSGDIGTQFFNSPQSMAAYRQDFGANGTAVGPAYLGGQVLTPSAAPTLSITGGPADASTVYGSSVTFTYLADSGYTAVCQLDGNGWRPCTSSTTDVLQDLSPGFHVWDVQVSDDNADVTLRGRAFVVAPATSADARLATVAAATRAAGAKKPMKPKKKTTKKSAKPDAKHPARRKKSKRATPRKRARARRV